MNLREIPLEAPFLDSLAAGLLTPGAAPSALAEALILLPTRRAARALRDAFLRQSQGAALLLPRMGALAGLSVEEADELALPALLDLPPAVAPARRQAALARAVLRLAPSFGGSNRPDQAWRLAADLAALLDEIALEGCDPTRLSGLVPEQFARHWQVTQYFLEGVFAAWAAWLQENGLMDIGVRRIAGLRAQAQAWRDAPPQHPVIVAGVGAGGTIPAALELLKVVAQLPRGAVVLRGAPEPADDAALWAAIGDSPTHPLAGQARLLHALGARPADLRPWSDAGAAVAPPARAALLAQALRPAAAIPSWQLRDASRWRGAMAGLSRLAARDAPEEAAAIALALRETLETPGATAALVTPDRGLARRVSSALARHGVTVDDSAGEPLMQTAAAAFLRLLARMVAERFAPVPLLAALKHPLCAAGLARGDWLARLHLLEGKALRGQRPAPGLDGLRAAARDEPRLLPLLDSLQAALGGFTTLPVAPARPPGDLLAAHLAAAEALAATDDTPGGLRLYAGEEGEPLATHLASLQEAMDALGPVSPADWPGLFDAALEGPLAPSVRAVRSRGGAPHPRVQILGLVEARLLRFDRVVLGALEESIWPQATDPGPWMSRPMRKAFGLPEPEVRIGRVAADFLAVACSAGEALLSTAGKRGGAPSVQARWLTRLDTFLHGQGALVLPAAPHAAWAAALDAPDAVRPCARPAPRPPRAARPRRLSLSDVGLLIADPYAFYAKRVLRLTPLEPLDADIGNADYGMLVHDVLRRFLEALGPGWPGADAATEHWRAATDAALEAQPPRPAIAAFWGPRLARIGAFVVQEEAKLRAGGAIIACHTEVEGTLVLGEGAERVALKARADRIDQLADGGWRVLDYKTGQVPAQRALADGGAPQLPLEAAMLRGGAFPFAAPGTAQASMLTYWRLTGGDQPGKISELGAATREGLRYDDLAADGLDALVQRWLLGDATFVSRPHPSRRTYGDYDHLARAAEWAAEDSP